MIKENEVLKDINKKLEDQMGELEGLKESNKKIMYEMEELYALTNIKRKRVLNGEEIQENLSKSKEQKYIMTERMTKSKVDECKEKIMNFRNNIKNMKIENKNEIVLLKIIEDICDKLQKTIFSSFKKVAVSEFDKFLKISTVEKQKILKK